MQSSYQQDGVSNVYSLFRGYVSIHLKGTQEFHFEASVTLEQGAGYVHRVLGSAVIASQTLEITPMSINKGLGK